VLVSGERLVGKTAFLQLVARRLAPHAWTRVRGRRADLMAGQQWFGQLEGRIRQAVDQLTLEKKVVWYIPDLLALARSGTHQGQSASILDQILPAVVAGRLVVWTEATPTSVARLLQMRRRCAACSRWSSSSRKSDEATLALTLEVAKRISADAEIDIDPGAPAWRSRPLANISTSQASGAALQLLKLAAVRSDHESGKVEPNDVLKTLSQLTGLPISILDTKERIDLAPSANSLRSA